ncbi:MAG: AraC family transcriptional regulator, partial [Planctomycetota bacterium]|nr:AraC family transcriptional regulator [Planctomycetota bacterium]
MTTQSATRVRRVILLVYPEVRLLDVAGLLQVFRDARGPDGAAPFRVQTVSAQGGPIETDAGVPLPTSGLRRLRLGPSDLLLVPGGPGARAAAADGALLRWVAEHGPKAGAIASTCTGAFVLAAAGLLDGRRAVTHWEECQELQRLHPAIQVDSGPIFLEDGGVWTSAGMTAGIDLALALVERELDRDASVELARRLVVPAERPGGQAPFGRPLEVPAEGEGGRFEELHRWIIEHITE